MASEPERQSWRAAVAVAAAALLAVSAIACGDSGDGKPARAAEKATEPAAAPARTETETETDTNTSDTADAAGPQPGTAEADIIAGWGIFRDYLEFASASASCSKLSRGFVERLGGEEGCHRHFERIFASRTYSNRDRRFVVAWKVDGRRARVRVRVRKGVTFSVPFAREKTGWKIDGGRPWR